MTPFVLQITHIVSFFVLLSYATALLIVASLIMRRKGWAKMVLNFFGSRAILLSFLMSVVATATSLFYSNVAGFDPCLLCWWQRIFMYPQVVLLGIALIIKDKKAIVYGLALSCVGVFIAIYHTYLQFGGSSILPCSADNASTCGKVYFLEYGFINIPTMSLAAFLLIISLMVASLVSKKHS